LPQLFRQSASHAPQVQLPPVHERPQLSTQLALQELDTHVHAFPHSL
jgi:hypothetical protein